MERDFEKLNLDDYPDSPPASNFRTQTQVEARKSINKSSIDVIEENANHKMCHFLSSLANTGAKRDSSSLNRLIATKKNERIRKQANVRKIKQRIKSAVRLSNNNSSFSY